MPDVFVRLEQGRRMYQRGRQSITALASATCTVHAGDRIAVVGRSGSGKSTLLHLFAGLETLTSGTISWPGLGLRETLRPTQIGVVFQTPSLLAPLTVIENVEVPLLLAQGGGKETRSSARDLLERMSLLSLAEKLPEELSGGQAQRVALARALICHPRLLLADEPTGQLDHPTAERLFDLLFDALDGTDTALVVATHDLTVARRMQTIWRMQYGRLEEWDE
jgi:predicted ABC-type transport system involved in lysophospholipase L1 biosynthesis ATPase subunit